MRCKWEAPLVSPHEKRGLEAVALCRGRSRRLDWCARVFLAPCARKFGLIGACHDPHSFEISGVSPTAAIAFTTDVQSCVRARDAGRGARLVPRLPGIIGSTTACRARPKFGQLHEEDGKAGESTRHEEREESAQGKQRRRRGADRRGETHGGNRPDGSPRGSRAHRALAEVVGRTQSRGVGELHSPRRRSTHSVHRLRMGVRDVSATAHWHGQNFG
mmetsp:Transcript_9978/g.26451  ORF Transcript_9978/g.26451 Transcript_9978/m.26451 type:complete len:217 (-) Transcript_9978:510-1160(-)